VFTDPSHSWPLHMQARDERWRGVWLDGVVIRRTFLAVGRDAGSNPALKRWRDRGASGRRIDHLISKYDVERSQNSVR